ncbi:MAG: hypothetical protein FJ387_30280 [Verrucomicrobia bacterium]|nr:hypothetical protein [Verrucomicrobiota bacterium]
MSNDEKSKAKEVIRQESFWFAATTLGFIGFVGALLKTPSSFDLAASLTLIVLLSAFTTYLLVCRHRAYCQLNDLPLSWPKAFAHAVQEFSGTLYCIVVVLFAAFGFALIILMRYSTPLTTALEAKPQAAVSRPTSAVAPPPISISATSAPARKP